MIDYGHNKNILNVIFQNLNIYEKTWINILSDICIGSFAGTCTIISVLYP